MKPNKAKDKKFSKGQGKRPSKPGAQKRPRSEEEDKSHPHAAASRANQFRETKLHRKAVKPDNELLDQAKVIYNVVKPNDVRGLDHFLSRLPLTPAAAAPRRRR